MKVKNTDWYYIIGAVFLVWFIDFGTKQWALAAISPNTLKFWGPIGWVLHRNPGAMLGMFSDLPPVLRIVTLSTGGAFLIFVYAVIQYLLPMKSIMLRVGMSFLLGGILGNVTDRTLWGSVVDFIILGTRNFHTPAFNFADAIQWVGYIMVVYALVRDGHLLWPTKNTRKRIWVNPQFQLKYIFVLISVGSAFAIIIGVFNYTYMKIMIDEITVGSTKQAEAQFLIPYLYTFLLISLGFVIFLFVIGRILSHRIAGPLYAFELYLKDLVEGNYRFLRLRAHDEFLHLEDLGNELTLKVQGLDEEHKKAEALKESTDTKEPKKN